MPRVSRAPVSWHTRRNSPRLITDHSVTPSGVVVGDQTRRRRHDSDLLCQGHGCGAGVDIEATARGGTEPLAGARGYRAEIHSRKIQAIFSTSTLVCRCESTRTVL